MFKRLLFIILFIIVIYFLIKNVFLNSNNEEPKVPPKEAKIQNVLPEDKPVSSKQDLIPREKKMQKKEKVLIRKKKKKPLGKPKKAIGKARLLKNKLS